MSFSISLNPVASIKTLLSHISCHGRNAAEEAMPPVENQDEIRFARMQDAVDDQIVQGCIKEAETAWALPTGYWTNVLSTPNKPTLPSLGRVGTLEEGLQSQNPLDKIINGGSDELSRVQRRRLWSSVVYMEYVAHVLHEQTAEETQQVVTLLSTKERYADLCRLLQMALDKGLVGLKPDSSGKSYFGR